ncbi:hypothetical protein Oter_3376 [Opitutus terrae PB90-1]|uniref:Asparagine synthetase domain-containing protein n=2 Tax=Opitutus terrae TaxID=107709 RepID=B1ZU91_OPITP|nr:hypothetical protein Oter_3376 [Opitutus terrae PB90-1]
MTITERTQDTVLVEVCGEPLAQTDFRQQLADGAYARIVDTPGEFWVARRQGETITLVASRHGIKQCFYTVREGRFYYGPTVDDVVKASNSPWQWNARAIASVACYWHTLGSDSLHAKVRRLGAAEMVAWDGSALKRHTFAEPVASRYPNPVGAATEFLVEFIRRHGDGAILPLSAGFDSRAILAAFLSLGRKPICFVMGHDGATDVRVAKSIAARFGLELRVVALAPKTYVENRDRILTRTSGTKTPGNWHTWVGAKTLAPEKGMHLFPGSNGEYARTFFYDRGMIFQAANALSSLSVPAFLSAKVRRSARFPSGSAPELAYWSTPAGQKHFTSVLAARYGQGSLGDLIDDFYLKERVRNFIGNGIELYSDILPVRLPFLQKEWIDAVRGTSRQMRLNCRWHKAAIGKLCPPLLEFPTDETGTPMGRPESIKEKLLGAPHGPCVGYSPDLLNTTVFRALLTTETLRIPELFGSSDLEQFLTTADARSRDVISLLALWRDYLVRSGTSIDPNIVNRPAVF